jgi:hypothetical protein
MSLTNNDSKERERINTIYYKLSESKSNRFTNKTHLKPNYFTSDLFIYAELLYVCLRCSTSTAKLSERIKKIKR